MPDLSMDCQGTSKLITTVKKVEEKNILRLIKNGCQGNYITCFLGVRSF